MNPTTPASPPRAVWFPDWADALARADLPETTRAEFRRAILAYLRFCKATRQRATVASARQFMQEQAARQGLGGPALAEWKTGVNWFFRAGNRAAGRGSSLAERTRSPVPKAALIRPVATFSASSEKFVFGDGSR